jgi:hypothetical protein
MPNAGCGCWKLKAGNWKLGTGNWKLANMTSSNSLVVLGLAALLLAPVGAQSPDGNALERVFARGGTVRLDLGAGEYRISGTADEKLRVRWSTRKPEDMRRVRVSADVAGRSATVRTGGPRNGFRVEIEMPERSDVRLELSAGEVRMRGIEGSKDISMWAGEVSIEVGDTARYRQVDASVRFGEIGARPFNVSKEGIFRSFRWSGRGEYVLRARLFAGEVQLIE